MLTLSSPDVIQPPTVLRRGLTMAAPLLCALAAIHAANCCFLILPEGVTQLFHVMGIGFAALALALLWHSGWSTRVLGVGALILTLTTYARVEVHPLVVVTAVNEVVQDPRLLLSPPMLLLLGILFAALSLTLERFRPAGAVLALVPVFPLALSDLGQVFRPIPPGGAVLAPLLPGLVLLVVALLQTLRLSHVPLLHPLFQSGRHSAMARGMVLGVLLFPWVVNGMVMLSLNHLIPPPPLVQSDLLAYPLAPLDPQHPGGPPPLILSLAEVRLWLVLFGSLALIPVLHYAYRINSAVQSLGDSAERDPLTGIRNRRGVARFVSAVQGPIAVVILDLDDFKAINDRFGHTVGDEVLRRVAWAAAAPLLGRGELFRWGGEEFLALIPLDRLRAPEDLPEMCETLRLAVLNSGASELLRGLRPVTASFGVAVAGRDALEAAVEAADKALYEAKRRGKNRVVRAPAWGPGSGQGAVVALQSA